MWCATDLWFWLMILTYASILWAAWILLLAMQTLLLKAVPCSRPHPVRSAVKRPKVNHNNLTFVQSCVISAHFLLSCARIANCSNLEHQEGPQKKLRDSPTQQEASATRPPPGRHKGLWVLTALWSLGCCQLFPLSGNAQFRLTMVGLCVPSGLERPLSVVCTFHLFECPACCYSIMPPFLLAVEPRPIAFASFPP